MPELTVFVCKTCGRGIKAEEKPNWCYGCRSDQIENISDEDAAKMGLFSSPGEEINLYGKVAYLEFPGDFNYNPVEGHKIGRKEAATELKLSDFQSGIMKNLWR